MKTLKALASIAVVIGCWAPATVNAAAVTAVTLNPDSVSGDTDNDGRIEVETYITSLTAGGVTYRNLIPPLSATPDGSGFAWGELAPQPVDATEAVSGLRADTAGLNTGVDFIFDHELGPNEVLFLFDTESGGGEDVTLYPIDQNGNRLDPTGKFVSRNERGNPGVLFDLVRPNNLFNRTMPGFTFTMDELGFGSLSGVYGFDFDSSDGIDVVAAGIAQVPEPGTMIVLAGGLGLIARRRR